MYIEFKELQFKNINSYGNKTTKFPLNRGLNCIAGVNGQGKSTILDALCFCLFGVPFRKVKIPELINRNIKKNLWTQIEFTSNKHEYRIARELKPDKIKIQYRKIEESEWTNMELLSSKKLIQEEIDRILGIDVNLFKQVISLAINYNDPFLSLSVPEKRNLMESIFNIKVFGLMLKNIKTDNTGIKTKYQVNTKTCTILKATITELKEQVEELESKKETFKEDKQNKITRTKNRITTEEEKRDKQKKTGNELFTECKKLKKDIINTTEINSQLSDLYKDIGECESNIKRLNRDIKFFENNTSCPQCKSDLTGDTIKQNIEDKKTEIIEEQEKLEQHNKIKSELEIIKEVEKKKQNKISKIEQELEDIKRNVKFYNKQIEEFNSNITDIEEEEFVVDINKMKTNLNKKNKEYNSLFEETLDLNKNIKMNDIIIKILGDEGIKTYFFKKLVPLLNEKINTYIKLFDLPVTITFDEYMNECINTLKDKYVPYMSFSEGEKKRIDIAILLSFIETTKTISNWGCNLLIFDELLDNSTDGEGLDKFFSAIKAMIDEDANLCTYVISHRTPDVEFDRKYLIQKKNGFSEVELKNVF